MSDTVQPKVPGRAGVLSMPLPPQVSRTAREHQLGDLIGVYVETRSQFRPVLVYFGALIVFGGVELAVRFADGPPELRAVVVLQVVALWNWMVFLRRRNKVGYLFDDGFILRHRNKLRTARWAEVAAFRRRPALALRLTVRILLRDGGAVTLRARHTPRSRRLFTDLRRIAKEREWPRRRRKARPSANS